MFQLANAIMSGKFLGSLSFWQKWYGAGLTQEQSDYLDAKYRGGGGGGGGGLTVLVPILAIVAAAGVIWAIVLGIQMARADSTEKREEAKKRLIGLIVGIVILVVLILFFTTLFPGILKSLIGLNPADIPKD